jgi:hypothetical protein
MWLRIATIAIGFLSAFAAVHLPGIVTKVLVSGLILGALFLAAEWFIREKLWRINIKVCGWTIKPFYCDLDFEDDWECATFYEAVESQDAERRANFKGHRAYHQAKIEQDARHISIRSSHGQQFNEWHSLMMALTDNGIAYAYSVTYAGDSDLKGNAIGFEELSVRQRESDPKNGKPILLFGSFSHCAQGQPEAFRGTAVFCSLKHLDKIKVDQSMPPQLKDGIELIRNERSKP